MRVLLFFGLSGLASFLVWMAHLVWWPFVVLPPAILGFLFTQARSRKGAASMALVAGFIAWRPYQDAMAEYGQIGVNTLVLWQAATLIPVALSLRWAWARRLRMVWFFPLAWIGGEYLRILGPLGFPLGALALPAFEQIWMIQAADLGGMHLVSAFLAMGSGLLLDAASALRPGEGFDRHRFYRSLLPAGSIAALVLLYGIVRLQQIEESLQPGPHIAVIQPDIPLTEAGGDDYDGEVLLAELQAMSEQAMMAETPPQLILWPEALAAWPLHNTEYLQQPFEASLFPELKEEAGHLSGEQLVRRWDRHRERLRKRNAAFEAWVNALGVPLVFGQITQIPTENNGVPVFARYNAARILRPGGGDHVERQFKVRLFPGGESVPGGHERLRTWLGFLDDVSDWLDGISPLQPGDRRERFYLDPTPQSGPPRHPIYVAICGEVLFPGSAAVFERPYDPSILLTIADEGRFQRRTAQLASYMTLPYRAVEARRAIARSANTGISSFVSPTGRLYGQVRNEKGSYWTGKGFPEEPALEAFRDLAETLTAAPSDPQLKKELASLSEEIRGLRQEAGVSGFSVAQLDYSPHTTLYQRTGDLFPQLALFGLFLTTCLACAPGAERIPY